jgi:sterol desaturase/sphingolipid hydroxylase (fatty acid hydroxylase superfamily)
MAHVLLVLLVNGGGFLFGGALLHWAYYRRRRATMREWKHQPNRVQSARQLAEKLPLVLVNMLIINTFIGTGVHLVFAGHSRTTWDLTPLSLLACVGPFVWYHVALYYVHRTMHRPWFFRRIHHLHHRYKTPVWLDALYEHPLEAVWGGIVLLTPVLVFPMWAPGYFVFVGIVGLHEVLDHAGIRIDLPILSKSGSHDDHHRYSSVYYGQLLPWLDAWHGTDKSRPRVR